MHLNTNGLIKRRIVNTKPSLTCRILYLMTKGWHTMWLRISRDCLHSVSLAVAAVLYRSIFRTSDMKNAPDNVFRTRTFSRSVRERIYRYTCRLWLSAAGHTITFPFPGIDSGTYAGFFSNFPRNARRLIRLTRHKSRATRIIESKSVLFLCGKCRRK